MSMYVALDENLNLVHISGALRGLACQCTCFECGETVIAKKGEINEHHFAHISNKKSCVIHPETVLHKYAKQVILESRGLQLPALPDNDQDADWWTFERIIPELHLGSIRPDLVGYCNNEPVFVEIAITHFIDQHKFNVIKNMQVKTIEIDLSSLLKSEINIPSDKAKTFILNSLAGKTWIYPLASSTTLEKGISSTQDVPFVESITVAKALLTPTGWEDYQFTINGIWVNVRKFSGGMISVNCTYNPEIIAMLKKWRNEGGGKFNPKYKSWNYWQPFSETVLARLQAMHKL